MADTTDLYATATGLIERSAAAYAPGVPEGAGDDGFFGPASVTWRMSADLASPVAGLRSLLMQALHPLAVAALLLWVHGALAGSVLAAASSAGTALPAADSNRYVAEMATAAELTGVPRHPAPSSVPGLDLYIASVRPALRCTPAAAGSMACLLDPPGLDEDTAGIWQDVRDAAIAVLPRWARQMYGYGAPPPITPGRRTGIRPSPGVLDAMFLGSARRARGAAAGHPADAGGAAHMRLIRLLTAVVAGAATLVLPRRRPGRLRLDRARGACRRAAAA